MTGALPDWLLPVVGSTLGVFVGTLIATRVRRAREVGSPGDAPALSVECWVRALGGEHPHLARRWRVGRAVVSHGSFEVRLFRWRVRAWKRAPFQTDVEAVDRDAVQRSGWLLSLRFGDSHRLVRLKTSNGGELQLALRPDDVAAVLEVLEDHNGLSRR